MKTILVIDDNTELLENTTEILELAGYNVITAVNGKIGVELAIKEMPDLILCDIMMPELDGFGVLITLNKNLRTAGIPFIFLTAKSEIQDKKYAVTIGADDYLIKPFDPDYLLKLIQTRIEKQEKTKEEINNELHEYSNELVNMLHITSHRVRSPICTCIGLIQLLEANNNYQHSEEDFKKILAHIKTNINDLEDFTKELTFFLHDTLQKKKKKLNLASSLKTKS